MTRATRPPTRARQLRDAGKQIDRALKANDALRRRISKPLQRPRDTEARFTIQVKFTEMIERGRVCVVTVQAISDLTDKDRRFLESPLRLVSQALDSMSRAGEGFSEGEDTSEAAVLDSLLTLADSLESLKGPVNNIANAFDPRPGQKPSSRSDAGSIGF